MALPAAKKANIRKAIIAAANNYSKNLSGKTFLYVFGKEYFEVSFQTKCFMHLTGVASCLSANSFYQKAKSSTLATSQFWFDSNHPYAVAKKKLSYLTQLDELTKNLVCVVKDMKTLTLTYKIGITNLDFTIGLTEDLDTSGNKISDYLLPRTLRVKDESINDSSYAEFVDLILSKDASVDRYDTICFCSNDNPIPNCIKSLLSDGLFTDDDFSE